MRGGVDNTQAPGGVRSLRRSGTDINVLSTPPLINVFLTSQELASLRQAPHSSLCMCS